MPKALLIILVIGLNLFGCDRIILKKDHKDEYKSDTRFYIMMFYGKLQADIYNNRGDYLESLLSQAIQHHPSLDKGNLQKKIVILSQQYKDPYDFAKAVVNEF